MQTQRKCILQQISSGEIQTSVLYFGLLYFRSVCHVGIFTFIFISDMQAVLTESDDATS